MEIGKRISVIKDHQRYFGVVVANSPDFVERKWICVEITLKTGNTYKECFFLDDDRYRTRYQISFHNCDRCGAEKTDKWMWKSKLYNTWMCEECGRGHHRVKEVLDRDEVDYRWEEAANG